MNKTIRLDKLLGHLGYGTRSGIKALVRQGAVTVNGERVKDSGLRIDPERDEVRLDGEKVRYREHVYVMLHKPAGCVSATEDNRERTVLELLDEDIRAFAPFPVGRLDKDTEGLLLLTNDGKLAHELLSPRKHVPKTYRALVAGEEAVGAADVRAFAAGVALDDGYVTLPAELRLLATGEAPSPDMREAMDRTAAEPALRGAELAAATAGGRALAWIELTIREGKYHQVKRMFAAAGKQVLYLRRVAMGPLALDAALAPGEWRELTEEETALLREFRGEHRKP